MAHSGKNVQQHKQQQIKLWEKKCDDNDDDWNIFLWNFWSMLKKGASNQLFNAMRIDACTLYAYESVEWKRNKINDKHSTVDLIFLCFMNTRACEISD